MKNKLGKRMIYSLIGVLLISTAVSIFRYCDLGTDPFSCFILGICNLTGLSFGHVQVIVNVTLIASLYIFGKGFYGMGTVMSMVLVGYISDFLLSLVPVEVTSLPMVLRYLILLVGVLTTSFGISLYSHAKLGISAYDSMSFILCDRFKRLPLQYTRIAVDALLVLSGFFMGCVVGLGTLIVTFGVGPCVAFFLKKITGPYIFPENEVQ